MRKGVLASWLAVCSFLSAGDGTGPIVVDFERDSVGGAPEGFAFGRTGKGPEGTWVVQDAEGAPSGTKVLAQTSTDDTDRRYPVAVWTEGKWADVAVSVRFKPLSGELDQCGGVVLRYADADNYYIARANSIERNCRFYSVKGGERKQLASANVDVPAGTWHELKVVAKGSQFTVWLDGKELLKVEDKTFTAEGSVGVWTKSDSVTQFDDLTIEAVK